MTFTNNVFSSTRSMSSNAKKSRKAGTSKEKEEEEYEPGSWECTVCTYRNNYEAFKCEICDTRKGTSTRKPRLNPSVVQQQTLVQNLAVQQSLGERGLKKQRNSDSRSRYSPESNFSVATSSRANVAASAPLDRDSPSSMRIDSRLLKRKMVAFRDALVVRSSVKRRMASNLSARKEKTSY